MVLGKTFRVWKKSQPRSVLLECKTIPGSLLFESGAIAVLTPDETEHVKKQYSKLIDAHACLGVLNVNLGHRHVKYLFLVTGVASVGRLYGSEIQRITDIFTLFLEDSVDPDYVSEVRKLLCSGTFYFTSQGNVSDSSVMAASNDFEGDQVDLSISAQNRYQGHSLDGRFIWNQNLHYLPLQYGVDTSRWLVRISCGSVEVRTVYAGSSKAKVTIMSRLSCSRAGTRFNVRGVDDYGEVANFVETEQAISFQKTMVSFVQLRGSIPLFWEQPGFQTGAHKVKMSRGFEACRPAFRRHVDGLRSRYGPQLFLSLLNIKEGEALLSAAFQDQVKDYDLEKSDLDIVTFDYHQQCRGGSQEKLTSVLLRDVADHLKRHGYFTYTDGKVTNLQQGVIRTNCMDCLDRTNAVQTFLGLHLVREILPVLGIDNKVSVVSRFKEVLREIWKINGDNISKIYAGTGAMEGKAKMGKLKDGAKSVARTVRNNFLDGSKQEAIDILLTGNAFVGDLGGRARALLAREDALGSSALKAHLCDRHKDFVEKSPLRVCVGTWNVNGGRQFRSIAYKNQSMHDWLLDAVRNDKRKLDQPRPTYTAPVARPRSKADMAEFDGCSAEGMDTPFETSSSADDAPHMFAIGFEELVDLNATNIVSTSSSNKKEWGLELQRVVSRDQEYALLTCEQLVGVCLYVFIQPRLLPHVRDVAIDSVKTGMHGKAGNKGGVAIRFLLYSTSFCFVCAHFAAGQGHAQERAADYAEITKRVSFPMGRSIESHDYVFWCGDFNYRIDLPIDDVKQLIVDRDFEALQKADQLRKQMKDAKVFHGYTEGITDFIPTYKYDLFSDDFDTSEKSRIPAWTDRVLWKHKAHPSFVEMIDSEEHESDGVSIASDDDGRSSALSQGAPDNEPHSLSNHGCLSYYGRAELRISDHRPVVAVVDVEVEKVNLSQRNATLTRVKELLGPADPTIVVHPQSTGTAYLDVELLTTRAEEFGIVVLIRLVDDDAYITFHDSRAALRALAMNGTQVGDAVVDVKLRVDLAGSAGTMNPSACLLDCDVPSIPLNILAASPVHVPPHSLSLDSAPHDVGNPALMRQFSAALDQDFVGTPPGSSRSSPLLPECSGPDSLHLYESGPSVDGMRTGRSHSLARGRSRSRSPKEGYYSRSRSPSPSYARRSHSPSRFADTGDDGRPSSPDSVRRIPPPIPPTKRDISPCAEMLDRSAGASSSSGSHESLDEVDPSSSAVSHPTTVTTTTTMENSSVSSTSPTTHDASFIEISLDNTLPSDTSYSYSQEDGELADGDEESLTSKTAPSRPSRPPRQAAPAPVATPAAAAAATAPARPAQPSRPSRPAQQPKSKEPAAAAAAAATPHVRAELRCAAPSRPSDPPRRASSGAPLRPDMPPARPGVPPSKSPLGAPARPARPNARPGNPASE